jgi:hypothetical protein
MWAYVCREFCVLWALRIICFTDFVSSATRISIFCFAMLWLFVSFNCLSSFEQFSPCEWIILGFFTGVGGPYESLHVHLYKCVCMQMLEAGVGLCNYGYLNHLLEFVSTCEFVSI